jgi:glycine/D-amino acid oxidase-like deaminating enzyme
VVSITAHRDLRTGQSIWQARRPHAVPTGPLRGAPLDVLVVGAGITGALVAEALTDAGWAVAVVDRRRPASGSTTASTALLQYEIDVPLTHLARRIGLDRAQRVWRRSRLALDALRQRVRHLGISAAVADRDSLYLHGNVLDRHALVVEAEARRRAGFEVTWLDAPTVESRFGIAGRTGLESYDNMEADPRQLATGFLAAAVAGGARVHAPVEVVDVAPGRRGVTATTATGARIASRFLVYATGYELATGVPRSGHAVSSTWAYATRPQTRRLWPGRCLIWEASDPYLYLRTTPDGRILCGGEDEPFADARTRDAQLPAKVAALERKLGRLLPDVDARADYTWCGSFGTSDTGTPSIGAVPGMPGCFAVLGYGGNGITFSMLAAQILRTTLGGQRDPDADLFSFTRRR